MTANNVIEGLKPCPRPEAKVRVVQTVDALKKLSNTFAYVVETATTYFVDSAHMPMVIASQPLFVDNYPALENPRKLISQTVYDFRNNVAYIFNNKGKVRSIKLEEVK